MKTIGVFGISGVGKTTFINALIAKQPNWLHISAGTLLQGRLMHVARDALRVRSEGGVLANQEIIVHGLSTWRQRTECDAAFFDGHLLIDSDTAVVEIPCDVIRRLELDAIIFLHGEASEIAQRRASDTSRARAFRSKEQLAAEQRKAMNLAQRFSEDLRIPLFVVCSDDAADVEARIASLVQQ